MPVVRNDVFRRTDSPFALGLNLVIGEKSPWPVTADFGYSAIERTDQNLETWSGLSFRGTPFTTADNVRVQLSPGAVPTLTTTRATPTAPSCGSAIRRGGARPHSPAVACTVT
jgi:iron complex outermembrane receptor protein